MNKIYEATSGPNLSGNSPIAYAARWFDAAEAEIHGPDVEGTDYWQEQLDRLESVAKVNPDILLEIARIQKHGEETPVDERFLQFGNLIQLSLMIRQLDDRATVIADALGSDTFPMV